MQYVMLIYETDAAFRARASEPDSEFWGAWRAYHQALVDAGVYVGGSPLEPPAAASVVRVESGKPRVQDGPFADTKEQVGGFILLEAPSLDQALEWAARCPAAAYGGIEVRPVDGHVVARMGLDE